MSGDFLDSNIIIYTFGAPGPKQDIADEIVRSALSGDARISYQVVQEVLNVLTQRSRVSLTDEEVKRALEDVLFPLWQGAPSETLFARALTVRQRYSYSFYDSLIIAAAIESGCTRLLSEDLQHGQRIEGLTIENPFREPEPSGKARKR